MQLTLEPTDEITRVEGKPVRVWKGTTDRGAPVLAYIAMVSLQTHDATENEIFDRELRELKVRRELVSFDYRMVAD